MLILTPIQKQSNQDWNTPIHLESNDPHIKVPLIFLFLIMIFYFYFYHQLWVKSLCLDIRNSSRHIGQTHLRFPKYLRIFDTEMHIKLATLIICLIYDNIINTSSPPKGEKTVSYIAHLIILSTLKETCIH